MCDSPSDFAVFGYFRSNAILSMFSMSLWPPITMATQHPDNACVPWWRNDAFIPTQDELDELILLFSQLPIDEYMWDWEGKYVDESVGEKLFARGSSLFERRVLGEDVHLTYRIPAFDGEKMHRMARAFMNVLSLADLAADLGLKRPPVTEMFLPLTVSADQPMKVRETFYDILAYHQAIFHTNHERTHDVATLFDVTPLVEDVPSLLSIERILEPYWRMLLKEKDLQKRGQRVFLARSDPALNSGLLPAVLAVKVAMSTAVTLGDTLGFPVHPILGTGSLPFRGSVNPLYVDTFLQQYAGTRTYSIQSAFRYDYDKDDVHAALEHIRKTAPLLQVQRVSAVDRARIVTFCKKCTSVWKPSIERLAPLINLVARHFPARRERLQHIGLFGYSRGVGKVKLPRAIGFTGSLYSLGIPPEIIATGRALLFAKKEGFFDQIDAYYPALKADLQHAGKYLNRENLSLLAKKNAVFSDIEEDIAGIEKICKIELGPEKPHHVIHRNITSTICHRLLNPELLDGIEHDIVQAGIIRRSLG